MIENEGLNYMPQLPLNMEVLAEGLRQSFSAWKRLPVNEQEQAVETNLQQIDALISKYGQELAAQLEPLRQEMLAAKERGFKEAVATPSTPMLQQHPESRIQCFRPDAYILDNFLIPVFAAGIFFEVKT